MFGGFVMSMNIDTCAKFGLSVHSRKSDKQPPLVVKKAISEAMSAVSLREQLGTFGSGSAEVKSPIVNRPCKVPNDIGSEEESAAYEEYRLARDKRFAWQKTLVRLFRDLKTPKGASWCFHSCKASPIDKAKPVDIIFSPKSGFALAIGLQTCQKTHGCPHCAEVKAAQDKKELEAMRACHLRAGGSIIMVSLTNSHHYGLALGDLVKAQKVAVDKLNQFISKSEFFAEFGGRSGTVKAWEKTYGKNGWHPHFHFLYYMNKDLLEYDENGDALEYQPTLNIIRNSLSEEWIRVCKSAGLPPPDDVHGVDVRDGTHASKYVGKWGDDIITMSNKWGSSDEIAKSHLKTDGKVPESLEAALELDKGLTPWQLLELAHNGDQKASELFIEYMYATFNTRQVYWYGNTKKIYDLEVEIKRQDDAQNALIAAKFPDNIIPADFVFIQVDPLIWSAVVHFDMIPLLLRAVEQDVHNGDFIKKRITQTLLAQCAKNYYEYLLRKRNGEDAKDNIKRIKAEIRQIVRDTEIDTELRKSGEYVQTLDIDFLSDIAKKVKKRMGSKSLDYGLDLLSAVYETTPKNKSVLDKMPDDYYENEAQKVYDCDDGDYGDYVC